MSKPSQKEIDDSLAALNAAAKGLRETNSDEDRNNFQRLYTWFNRRGIALKRDDLEAPYEIVRKG